MLLLLKITALQLAWFSCLPIYMTAKQQTMLERPMAKKPAWLIFGLLSVIATYSLAQIYHPLTASLFVLVVWMTAWVALAFWGPQQPSKFKVVLAGSMFALLISLLGGPYVV